MEKQAWKNIWKNRKINIQDGNYEEIFLSMKKAAGFDLLDEGLTFEAFLEQWKRIDKNVSFSYADENISSIYEVGCGAGANLYLYQILKDNYKLRRY